MIATLEEAREKLLSEGLLLSQNDDPTSTLIYGSFEKSGTAFPISHDASALFLIDDHWVAAFPSRGLPQYRVAGSLPELVDLIIHVYRHYRQTGVDFWSAFADVIPNADNYLTGRQPATV